MEVKLTGPVTLAVCADNLRLNNFQFSVILLEYAYMKPKLAYLSIVGIVAIALCSYYSSSPNLEWGTYFKRPPTVTQRSAEFGEDFSNEERSLTEDSLEGEKRPSIWELDSDWPAKKRAAFVLTASPQIKGVEGYSADYSRSARQLLYPDGKPLSRIGWKEIGSRPKSSFCYVVFENAVHEISELIELEYIYPDVGILRDECGEDITKVIYEEDTLPGRLNTGRFRMALAQFYTGEVVKD